MKDEVLLKIRKDSDISYTSYVFAKSNSGLITYSERSPLKNKGVSGQNDRRSTDPSTIISLSGNLSIFI